MKKILSIIVICLSFLFSIQAQEVADTIQISEPINLDSVSSGVDINQLLRDKNTLIEAKNLLQDSLDAVKNEVVDLKQKNEFLESRLLFADSIVARLSNDCLRKKYDSNLVRESLENFSQMYSVELQERLSPVKELLQNYGLFYQEIVSILQSAQNNSDMSIPSIGKQTANSYINQIKKSQYYQKCYKKNWNIPFLEKLIDRSLETLKEFDPMSMDGIILVDFK